MTFSVLISVYNNETPQHFQRALQSIWDDQVLRPTQIVIVQDGPLNDNLLAVLDNWKNKLLDKLIILKNPQNLGLTKSLNKGIDSIFTDLIARMDSDDISAPTRFKEQVTFLEEHPDVDIVGGSIQEFNNDSNNLAIRRYPQTHFEAMTYIYKASPFAHPAVMMRKNIFNKIKYDERYRISQDIALWYDAAIAGYKFANINNVVLYFRKNNDVFRRRAKDKAWGEFKIYMSGIYRLYGPFTYKYIYAFMRLFFRLLPVVILKKIYDSKIRLHFLQ